MTWPPRLLQWKPDIVRVSVETGGRAAPELIASIIDRESRGVPTVIGDNGHGHGLMQIDNRYHKAWLDLGLWRIPLENIRYGVSRILLPNLDTTGGWPGAIAAYNASMHRVLDVISIFGQDVDRLDALTTHGDYVSSVLAETYKLQGLS